MVMGLTEISEVVRPRPLGGQAPPSGGQAPPSGRSELLIGLVSMSYFPESTVLEHGALKEHTGLPVLQATLWYSRGSSHPCQCQPSSQSYEPNLKMLPRIRCL